MKRIVFSDKAPVPIGPYSQAVQSGALVFVSGQIPINPDTGEVMSGPIAEQTRLVLKNISMILKQADSSLENVLKITVFLADLSEFGEVNTVFEEYFKSEFPARETVEVSCLPKNAGIEISAIAVSNLSIGG